MFRLLPFFLLLACSPPPAPPPAPEVKPVEKEVVLPPPPPIAAGWVEITPADGFVLDLRYARTDNFTGKIIYPCARCLLRPEVAEALQLAREEALRNGYRLVLFDCYRPLPMQEKLWEIKPHPGYVTDPKKGSMHNRGAAVDIGLADSTGALLFMGSDFDHFGEESHHTFTALDSAVLARRVFLKNTLEKHGFRSIRTEWWHYSYTKKNFPLSDYSWPCP